jgi:hypothetical protein
MVFFKPSSIFVNFIFPNSSTYRLIDNDISAGDPGNTSLSLICNFILNISAGICLSDVSGSSNNNFIVFELLTSIHSFIFKVFLSKTRVAESKLIESVEKSTATNIETEKQTKKLL